MPSLHCRRRSEVARGALGVALLVLAACAAPPWDLAALERGHPALARVDGHRLAEGTPYVLPRRGELLWFLCRWDTVAALRTALPADASPRERELLALALSSWQAAGLGVRFEVVGDARGAEIAISIGGRALGKAGRTGAECGVVDREGGFVARLVRAEIELSRTQGDFLGREVALTEAEWLGGAVHELGHALGFQGHTRGGPGPMVKNVEQVRRIGRHLLAGRRLEAATLRALYAVPSGTRVARVTLPPGDTDVLDRLGRLARDRGYRGPVVRVGDRAARIAWWSREGRSVGVRLPDIRGTLDDPRKLAIEPDLVARAWLGPGASLPGVPPR